MPREEIKSGDRVGRLLTLMIFKRVMRQAAEADRAEPVGVSLPISIIYLILRSLFCSFMTGRGVENPLPPTESRALESHQGMAVMWPGLRAERIVRCPPQAAMRTRGVDRSGLC
jgi:hypothetical protein